MRKKYYQPKIEINDRFKQALEFMENTSKNVFVTGRAGTGKSTLLDYFRNTTKKKVVILAPTGVAALNVYGQTIHSFFRFKPNITLQAVRRKQIKKKKNIYKKIEAIVIDEISMVRADLLDCVDKFLRLNGKNSNLPFGGVQMIFIGDLYQLPPVVTAQEKEILNAYQSPYFFDARAFKNFKTEFIELEKVYRQKDQIFINLLNSIRNNSATDEELEMFNKRYRPDFEDNLRDFYVYLTPTNNLAEDINNRQLAKLQSKKFYNQGEIWGNFDLKYLPTQIDLELKIDSQVMLLNNDSKGRWVNGSIGKIINIERSDGDNVIVVKLTNGRIVDVILYTWEMFRYFFNKKINSIDSEVVGSFTQYPIKLAWAVTIHKSQGKTFDKVILDAGKGMFAHGQMYVALSRCTSLDGLVLKKPIQKKHIFMDWRVVKFLTQYQWGLAEKNCSQEKKIEIIKKAIKNKKKLKIIYLKSNDVKSERNILPRKVGEMEYMNVRYLGLKAYCSQRREERNFRVDRILELKELS